VRGCGKRRRYADNHNQSGEDRSQHPEALMSSGAAPGDQRNLRNKKDHPGRHHQPMYLHQQPRQRRSAKETFQIISPRKTRQDDQGHKNSEPNV